MSQTIAIYAGPNCPKNWVLNALERHLTMGKTVNYYNSKDSLDVEKQLDPKHVSKYRKIQFESDGEAVSAFKNQHSAKVAIGVTKAQSLELECPSVLLDVPTCLVLEGADVSSLAVLLAQNLGQNYKTLNVVIMECFEKDFVQTLHHHALRQKQKLLELDCFANFEEEMPKVGSSAAVIVRHCNTKTATFVTDQCKATIINVHPIRTIQEGIGYVNKFPYRSNLYLWTDSVSILFSTWRKLDFANIYANLVKPMKEKVVYLNGSNVSESFMNSALAVPPIMFNVDRPIDAKKATKVYEVSVKGDYLSLKDVQKKILDCFPSWKLRGSIDLLCWAERGSSYQVITECKPKEKLTVGAYVNDVIDVLPTFLFAMHLCRWEKLVLFTPEELKLNEDLNLQVSELQSAAGDSSKYHLIFAPNGLLSIQDVDEEQFEGCTRRYGLLTGVELAKHVVFESSLVKQIQIPFNFITT